MQRALCCNLGRPIYLISFAFAPAAFCSVEEQVRSATRDALLAKPPGAQDPAQMTNLLSLRLPILALRLQSSPVVTLARRVLLFTQAIMSLLSFVLQSRLDVQQLDCCGVQPWNFVF